MASNIWPSLRCRRSYAPRSYHRLREGNIYPQGGGNDWLRMAGDVRFQNSATYLEELRIIHQELGIPDDCMLGRQGPIFLENDELVRAGFDLYNRELYLAREAAGAWNRMQSAARHEGVTLIVVSGFRSVRRQQEIIRRKLDAGLQLIEILRANAAPGFSQHHTGFALDLADDSTCEPLSEAFEQQPAFEWLSRRASIFGFGLQYPRGNFYGFIYEPWHWALDTVHDFALRRA